MLHSIDSYSTLVERHYDMLGLFAFQKKKKVWKVTNWERYLSVFILIYVDFVKSILTILTFAERIRRENSKEFQLEGLAAKREEIEGRVFDWYIMKVENIWQLHSMLGIEIDKW